MTVKSASRLPSYRTKAPPGYLKWLDRMQRFMACSGLYRVKPPSWKNIVTSSRGGRKR